MRFGKEWLLLSVGLLALVFAGPIGDPASAMNLGGFQMGRDRRLDDRQVAVPAEPIDEVAQIGKGRRGHRPAL